MIRQYGAHRCRGGDNPLRVGVIAVGNDYYLQDEMFFHDRYGRRAICRVPWRVEGFLNGTCGAARRNRETGTWEAAYCSGRSDAALVRSLRDRRQVRQVAVHLLIVHEDLGLCKEPTFSPSLPDLSLYCGSAARTTTRIRDGGTGRAHRAPHLVGAFRIDQGAGGQ